LEAAIYNYVLHHNADPKAFVWTKSAEVILKNEPSALDALEAIASGNQATVSEHEHNPDVREGSSHLSLFMLGRRTMRLGSISDAAEGSGSLQKSALGRIFVSVIMPIRNEEMFIERSLRAVLSQDYPHELLEVLIADGQSEDGTREVIASLARAHPDFRLVLIENPGRILSTGFNIAFSQAIA
jgi:hypothetical protein